MRARLRTRAWDREMERLEEVAEDGSADEAAQAAQELERMIDELPVAEREEIVAQLQENDSSEATTLIETHVGRTRTLVFCPPTSTL